MKKIKIGILSLIIAIFFLPIGISAAGGVSVSTSRITLEHGGSSSFKITANNAAGKVTINSNNNSVVTIDKSSEWIENQTINVNVKAVSAGSTTITVNVNAATFDEEKIINTYTINVTVNPPKSSNNNLKGISINGAALSGFSAAKTSYDLGQTTDKSITIAATTEDSEAKVSGTGSKTLSYGKNTFKVTVTAENGATKSYSITVTRPDNRSKDNTLTDLDVSPLGIKFNKNKTSYSVNAEHDIDSIKITAKTNDSKATVTGTGTKKLNNYVNTFTITVTAENGSKKNYTIKVIRKDEEGNLGFVSKDNTLKNITIEGYEIQFEKDTLEYSIEVDNLIETINITAVTNHDAATYEVSGNDKLKVGLNTIKINVTAESGDVKTYTINVTRKNNSPTTNFNDLKTTLEKTTTDEIIIEIKDANTTIDEKTIKTIKDSKKKYIINNYDGELINYSWVINSKNIGSINKIETQINFESDNSETIEQLTNYANSIYLNFKHEGNLPKGTKVRIYVGNKYKNKTKLNLYYYNEEKEKIELVDQELKVVNGYVEIELEHCSEYVLTKAIVKNKFNIFIPITIIETALIVSYLIMKFVPVKKKKKQRKTKNKTDK